MTAKTRWLLLGVGMMIVGAVPGWAQEPSRSVEQAPLAESLRAEIDALRPAQVAWRGIAWKSCLLDGLQEARRQAKPLLLWVFIDRPCDDARC